MKYDLVLVIFGRVTVAVIALLALRAMTTYLSPADYGQLSLLLAVQSFIGLLLFNPISQHISLHTHSWFDENSLKSRMRFFWLFVLVISAIGGAIALTMFRSKPQTDLLWITLSVVISIASLSWNSAFVPMLNMLGYRRSSIVLTVLTTSVGLLASLVLVTWNSSSASWLMGQAIGLAIGGLLAKRVIDKTFINAEVPKAKLPLISADTIISYCVPLAIATGLMWVSLGGYRFVVEHYWGLGQLGLFVIGLQLSGQIFSLAESVAVQFLYPFFFREVSDFQDNERVRLGVSDLLNTLIPLYILLAGFVSLTASFLLRILVAPEFWSAAGFVILGAGFELTRVLGNLLGTVAHIKRSTIALALPYAVSAAIILFSIIFLGETHASLVGAGGALLAGGCAMLVVMLMSMYRKVKFRIDFIRCSIAFFISAAMAFSAVYLLDMLTMHVGILFFMVTAIITSLAALALLWKNPSTLRLLSVRLREA